MALVVAGGSNLIACVSDPVPRRRCLVPQVTYSVPYLGHLITFIGHQVTFIGQMVVEPLRRPLIYGSLFLSCLVTLFGCAFAPIRGHTPALVCLVAFGIGVVALLAGRCTVIIGGIPRIDGLHALMAGLVAFPSRRTATTKIVATQPDNALPDGFETRTPAGGRITCCLARRRVTGHAVPPTTSVGSNAQEAGEGYQ